MSNKKKLELISQELLDGKPDKAIDKLEEYFFDYPDAKNIVTDYRTNLQEWLRTEKSDDNYNVARTKIKIRLQSFIDSYRNALHTLVYIFSNPKNKAQLNFQDELEAIQDSLSTKGPFKIDPQPEIVPAITQDEFFHVIQDKKPGLLLLSMHGDRDKGFSFLDSSGNESIMTPEKFISDLKAAVNFSEIPLECVVLNCCNSALHARELATVVPFTVGMDGLIYNRAAVLFARGFYKNLILTGNYDKSFEAGIYEIRQNEELKDMAAVPQRFHKL